LLSSLERGPARLTDAEETNDAQVQGILRELVAIFVATGAPPAKIYATIKTGRMLTIENMKVLSKADIKEWQDAGDEYERLADVTNSEKAVQVPHQQLHSPCSCDRSNLQVEVGRGVVLQMDQSSPRRRTAL
jgi:hypothetical protein